MNEAKNDNQKIQETQNIPEVEEIKDKNLEDANKYS